MAKPIKFVTPEDRMAKWKKLWATPKLLDDEATDLAFEEFQEAFVPTHMHKKFLQFFGTPRAAFGNRFFYDDAVFMEWTRTLRTLGLDRLPHVEVTVIYGSPDRLEAHQLRGEPRRALRDIIIDDWQAACAIVRGAESTLYVFVEPKMRGCMVRTVLNAEE